MFNTKKALRICPCNSYDIEGIQSWLEDLSMDGLRLEKDGYFGGVFTFLRTTPKKVIYRLVPVKKENSTLFDENDPDSDEVERWAGSIWSVMVCSISTTPNPPAPGNSTPTLPSSPWP